MLTATREIRDLISSEADLESLRDFHRQTGGRSLLEGGVQLAEEGKTSLEEVVRVALFD